MYNKYDFDYNINMGTLHNKLFCTFAKPDDIEPLVESIFTQYTILYKKIFVLYIKDNDEYVCTYNIEPGNQHSIMDNTILVHRKKESNTLYTINSLNELIKKLNVGIVDEKYNINWLHYRNSILLTHQGELKQLKTKLYKIIEV